MDDHDEDDDERWRGMGAARLSAALRWRTRRLWIGGRDRLCGLRNRLPSGSPDVALTFDDGPDPRFTPGVLDALAALGAPATFFCVGDRAAEHPDLVRRLVAEGHQLGIHCGTHRDLWTLSTSELAADMRRGREVLEDVVGDKLTLFRPAKGHFDLRTGVLAKGLGLRTWLWDVDPEDWRPGATSPQIAASASSAGPGAVILLHDGLEQAWAPEALDRSATVAALEPMVGALRARGLRFVGLPA